MKDDFPKPMATYRLQFNHDFQFVDAQSLVPYFSRLGVTHLYASPILRARQSSTHGYDVVDTSTINPNLGDKTDLVNFGSTLQNHGLGLILDIVPNHMAASIENPYWRDVLTYGPSSPFASWFDIDWRMPDPAMWGRVLVPILGEPRAQVLEQDQIRLDWSDGRFLVRYFEHAFPVDPATIPDICRFGLEALKQRLGQEHPVLDKIHVIINELVKLPRLTTRLRRHVDIDRDRTEGLLGEFAHLVVQSPTIQQWVEETAEQFGQGEEGRSRLQKLLDSQPYRLVHWRAAARTINYRRFFDINELISIRQEDPHVFAETHVIVLRWIQEGLLNGLRIDHIDGLRDPLNYLERLSEAVAEVQRSGRPIPVFVEKILAPHEKLPRNWPVAGTTGYEFLNEMEAVFVSAEGFREIEDEYRRMLRRPVQFQQVAQWGKRRVLRHDLSPQVGRLADTLWRLAQQVQADRSIVAEESTIPPTPPGETPSDSLPPDDQAGGAPVWADPNELTKRDFVAAIVEVIVALAIYRTYVDRKTGIVSETDRKYLEEALQAARGSKRAPVEAIGFLGEILLLEHRDHLAEHEIHEHVNFIERFQQLTGPAAAKGVEDTALYSYVPLASLNEVGGESHPCSDNPVQSLHEANQDRAANWPATMLCATTHDIKRTADVRARLNVLSELPKLWNDQIRHWRRLNKTHGTRIGGKRAPETVAEYLLYQTIVGLWPASDPRQSHELPAAEAILALRERIEAYMIKAVREAKTQTSWTNQNTEYEEALIALVRGVFDLDERGHSPFLAEVQQWVARIARPGFWNSLSRTLVQFTAPGTPDLYQGDELWNFALVDPDNRRPVDYEKRKQLLDEIVTRMEGPEDVRSVYFRDLMDSPEDGRIKLHVIWSALKVRHDFPKLFAAGDYLPLQAEGSAQDQVFAFARVVDPDSETESPGEAAIVVVPRLTTSLVSHPANPPIGEDVWSDTVVHLPEHLRRRNWKCVLTGEPILSTDTPLVVKHVLKALPVGLLVAQN